MDWLSVSFLLFLHQQQVIQVLLSPDQPAFSSWQHFYFHQPPACPALCTSCRSPDPWSTNNNSSIIIHSQVFLTHKQPHLEPDTCSCLQLRFTTILSHEESFEPRLCQGVVAMTTQLTTKKKPMLIILAVRRVLWWANPLLSISCWEMTSPTPTNEPADRRLIQIPP